MLLSSFALPDILLLRIGSLIGELGPQEIAGCRLDLSQPGSAELLVGHLATGQFHGFPFLVIPLLVEDDVVRFLVGCLLLVAILTRSFDLRPARDR
jgi:hypothetical protein